MKGLETLIGGLLLIGIASEVNAAETPAGAPSSLGSLQQTQDGPWGKLEFYHIYLDAPDYLAALLPLPSQQTEWHFVGYRPGQVERFLQTSGVPLQEVERIYQQNRILRGGAGFVVYPDLKFLASLDAATRARIYATLGQWKENVFHKHPIVIQDRDLRAWFHGTQIINEIMEAMAQLVYFRGETALFSDVAALLGMVTSAREERELTRALTRTRTLVVRMRFAEQGGDDLEAIANYWTGGSKNKAVLPLLKSASKAKGERLDIVHLIPPLARKHLYMFPDTEDGLRGRYPDSFWTAVNFFRFTPIDIYRDSFNLNAHIRNHYEPVSGAYQYGDLIMLVRQSDRQAYHACIYLADNIVFTKNSPDVLTPWVLMTIDDMIEYHDQGRSPFLSVWRLNQLIEQPSEIEVPPFNDGVIELP